MNYEGSFKSRDGLDFYERRWEPQGTARAELVLLHGFGEHCSRYAHVGEAFNRAGIAVHTYDQRGFGHSPGKRGYVHDFDVLLKDLDTYLEHVRPRLEGKTWFFMGHSMGGLLLARYAETRNPEAASDRPAADVTAARGLVFSSPFLAFTDDVPAILWSLAGILGTITPWLPVRGVDNTGLSRDPKVIEAASNDPLSFNGRVRARTGAQFQAAITKARAHFKAVTSPVYIIHGADDKIVPSAGSRLLYERCRSQDKTFKIYEGGYHELWNDLEKDVVLAEIVDWIAART